MPTPTDQGATLATAIIHLASAVQKMGRRVRWDEDLDQACAIAQKVLSGKTQKPERLHIVIRGGQELHLTGAEFDTLCDEVSAEAKARHQAQQTEGFARPAFARKREVRTAVMALQRALGVGEDGIVGPATMQAIEGIRANASIYEQQQHEADRVMIRAVRRQLGDGDRDDDGNAVWVIDRTTAAHRAPFSPGDIIIDSSGSSGFREILQVQPHPDVERLLRLVVRRVDGLVFDTEEF